MTETELLSIAETERQRQSQLRCRIGTCVSTGCLSGGSMGIFDALNQAVQQQRLTDRVEVVPTGCMGLCSRGPLVRVTQHDQPQETFLEQMTPEAGRQLVADLAAQKPIELKEHFLDPHLPFFTRQKKIVLANAGQINPERIEEYIARDGYAALAKVLREWSPQLTCDELTRSGLRGRGGAGYPTGVKWNLVRKSPGTTKYVIANGDEGDPGAYMDRSIMEADPHRVVEGLAIAAYAVGAKAGYIYVRGEYPIAVRRLDQAIKAATKRGLLGKGILGTNFEFTLEIRIGAGAFVCGEETALIASVEGKRGLPRPRPPYPSESGLHGCPTLINNVETLAAVAPICLHGADWFASIGTPTSKGTKVFALSGAVVHNGLIEVPMGTTLRDIVFEIGGGMPPGKRFKAVQTGGPSGGCIPESHLDLPVDYESLQQAGSIMGSGGMIIMDDSTSMVDVARFFMEFCRDESCGKCIPCRAGTVQMYHLLDTIQQNRGTLEDLQLLEELCEVVKATSLCGLGQTAPNPVLSTLKYFRDEYLGKIAGRRRPQGLVYSLPVLNGVSHS